MAVFDPNGGVIVISIVYDGPPLAGKTTSVRALARSVGREVYTPEEREGRTVYFDWLEYTGGRFEGWPIRCQIVSVPGQSQWVRRRARFLGSADVVVFVGDTRVGAWPETLERLRDLRGRLDKRSGVPVGLVFQANKRDLPDAVAIGEVRSTMVAERIGVVESIAHEGVGIRESFVLAVRLALDRVREEQRLGILPKGAPEFGQGEEVLTALRAMELALPDMVAPLAATAPAPVKDWVPVAAVAPAPVEARAAMQAVAPPVVVAARAAMPVVVTATPAMAPPPPLPPSVTAGVPQSPRAAPAPLPPSPDAPSGAIWPPVDGRVILHEVASQRIGIHETAGGDWVGEPGAEWRLHSKADAVYRDVEAARADLVSWARQHANARELLSQPRCIVLAETGDGRWRLWQIVKSQPSLRELCSPGAEATCGYEKAKRLLNEATDLCARAPLGLLCSLDTIGVTPGERPIYVGLVPRGSEVKEQPDRMALAHELRTLYEGRPNA